MRILVLVLVALGLANASWADEHLSFRARLEAMGARDQDGRAKLLADSRRDRLPQNSPQYADLRKLQRAIDLRNQGELDGLVQRYGWPAASSVGARAAAAALVVVEHAGLAYQKKYLPRVREAVARQEATASDLAVLEDSIRVGEGQPQVYGTRVHFAPDGTALVYPIADPAGVDHRRAQVGLGPLAYYLRSVDQRYGSR